MAEHREDNRTGRMLFTDFDASDKGRPVAALADLAPAGGEPDAFLDVALPTIADLAQALDLEFEDDPGDEAPPPSRRSTARRADASVDDEEEGGDAEESETSTAWFGGHIPTWEEYTRELREKREDADQPGQAAASDSRTTRILAPEPARRRRRSTSTTAIVPPPQSVAAPPGGIADGDAAFSDDDGGDYTQYPTDLYPMIADEAADDGFDILSALPPRTETGEEPDSGKSRGRRPGVPPPPETPYGGVERLDGWFDPPEESAKGDGEKTVERVEDWYEPPEEYLPGDLLDLLDSAEAGKGGPQTDMTETEYLDTIVQPVDVGGDAATRYYPRVDDRADGDAGTATETAFDIGRPQDDLDTVFDLSAHAGGADKSTETGIAPQSDMFSGIDLDGVWREKLREARESDGRRESPTSALDIFSGVDLDAAWQDKEKQAERGMSATRATTRPALKDTLVLDNQKPDNASTVILGNDIMQDTAVIPKSAIPEITGAHGPEAPEPETAAAEPMPEPGAEPEAETFAELAPASGESASDWEEAWRRLRGREADNPSLVDSGDAVGFLDDVDGMIANGAHDDSETPAVESEPERPKEYLNLDALIAEVDEGGGEPSRRDVAAPVIGDDAIADVRRKRKAEQSPDRAAAEPGDAQEAEAELAAIVDGAEPPPGPEEIPEGIGEDDGVAAPVVGDDDVQAIDGQPAERSGTREMEALFGGESGQADGEAEGEGEAPAEDAPVAVDPMDVFANMEDMDFSDDGLDDEMKAMLDDDDEAEEGGGDADPGQAQAVVDEPPPAGLKGKLLYYAKKSMRKLLPGALLGKLKTMIAWRENWWFYCDLLAAVVASASLAVIISYYVWYA